LPPAELPQEKVIFKGHITGANDLAFSPDGKTLVSAGGDGTVRLWDVASGRNKAIFKHPPQSGIRPHAWSVAFSPDGKTLASCDVHTIKIWEVSSGVNTETLRGFSENLLFSPDGKKLVAAGSRIVWDLETKKERYFLGNDYLGHPIAAFGPKGQFLIAANDRGVGGTETAAFSLWDADTSKKIRTFKGHASYVAKLAFSPDRKTLASAGKDLTLRLWDSETGKNTATFKDLPGYPYGLAFSPDSKVLACGCILQGRDGVKPRLGAVRLYETATGKILATLKGNPGPISPLAFSPDGRLLAAGCFDEHIRVWKLPVRYLTDE